MHACTAQNPPSTSPLLQVDPSEAPYLYYMMNQQQVGGGCGGVERRCGLLCASSRQRA